MIATVMSTTQEKYLPIESIRQDGGTQSRVGINWDVVEEYAQEIRQGAIFPAVTVFYDGRDYWLADGFHRIPAHQKAELKEIAVDLRQGTRRDAVLFSVGANKNHGLRRTNTDKQIAVETLLRDGEWGLWSDNAIAKACGVSQPFVSKLRNSACLSSNDDKIERTAQRQGKTYTIKTANIGNSSRVSSSHHSCNDNTASESIVTSTAIEELSDRSEHFVLQNATQNSNKEQDRLGLLESASDVTKHMISEPILRHEEELPLEVEQLANSSLTQPELLAACNRNGGCNMVEITAMLVLAKFLSALQITTLLNTFEQNLGLQTFGKLVIEAVPQDSLVHLLHKCLVVLSEREPTN